MSEVLEWGELPEVLRELPEVLGKLPEVLE